MLRSVAGLIVLALAGLVLSPSPAQAESRRIVAVGDLHGDWDAWQAIARAAGLIDGRDRWQGGRTILVQMGDVVDRGPDSLRIVRHLQQLQREAPRAGGQVIALIGNHEAMMMTGDLRYVHPGEYAAFVTRSSGELRDRTFAENRVAIEAAYRRDRPAMTSEAIKDAWIKATPLGQIEHQAAWSPTGRLGRWTLSNPAAVILGGTLFVHGGLSAELAPLGIEQINQRVHSDLRMQRTEPTAIINDPLGPLWYRGHISREPEGPQVAPSPALSATAQPGPPPRPGIDEELDVVLRLTGTRRIVVGHTPSLRGIIVDRGGKLVRIDSAISRAYGGTLSWLEIEGDRVTTRSTARPGGG
ncbi:metallophosphoesterase [Sphingomonas arenae]|uniref:metallophosphoesterase n=1 Tax=Sphingomonas arenae TaxID=2812555 RepID=UPI001967889E|nr:metallophosphoesterase [Sphingomonas arenae]